MIHVFGRTFSSTPSAASNAFPTGVLRTARQDGTEIFRAIHTQEMLDDFEPIGRLA